MECNNMDSEVAGANTEILALVDSLLDSIEEAHLLKSGMESLKMENKISACATDLGKIFSSGEVSQETSECTVTLRKLRKRKQNTPIDEDFNQMHDLRMKESVINNFNAEVDKKAGITDKLSEGTESEKQSMIKDAKQFQVGIANLETDMSSAIKQSDGFRFAFPSVSTKDSVDNFTLIKNSKTCSSGHDEFVRSRCKFIKSVPTCSSKTKQTSPTISRYIKKSPIHANEIDSHSIGDNKSVGIKRVIKTSVKPKKLAAVSKNLSTLVEEHTEKIIEVDQDNPSSSTVSSEPSHQTKHESTIFGGAYSLNENTQVINLKRTFLDDSIKPPKQYVIKKVGNRWCCNYVQPQQKCCPKHKIWKKGKTCFSVKDGSLDNKSFQLRNFNTNLVKYKNDTVDNQYSTIPKHLEDKPCEGLQSPVSRRIVQIRHEICELTDTLKKEMHHRKDDQQKVLSEFQRICSSIPITDILTLETMTKNISVCDDTKTKTVVSLLTPKADNQTAGNNVDDKLCIGDSCKHLVSSGEAKKSIFWKILNNLVHSPRTTFVLYIQDFVSPQNRKRLFYMSLLLAGLSLAMKIRRIYKH